MHEGVSPDGHYRRGWLGCQAPALNDGAVQDILAAGTQDTDLSGNPILKDVGLWMRTELKSHFKDADIKYIDPSYMIRSTPTISADRIYCKVCTAPTWASCHL